MHSEPIPHCKVVMHYGGLPGMTTMHIMLPKHNLSIMQFASVQSKSDALTTTAVHLINAALGIPSDDTP